MSKHTPGPWTLHDKDSAWSVTSSAGEAVLNMPKRGETKTDSRNAEEVRANAVLIAAAPEMLAALEAVGNGASSYGERDMWPEIPRVALTQARVAAAKAKGDAP